MKVKFFSLYLLAIFFSNCNAQTEKNYNSIIPAAFANKIKTIPNAIIVDVRTPEEFSSQHINKAININWNGEDFDKKISVYDKSKPIFVYCMSGGRSKKAAEKLNELGFKTIFELQGGITKWNSIGLPVQLDGKNGMSVEKYREFLNSDKKILIDFYAEWCAPCKKMTPYLLKIQKEMAKKVTVIRIDADKNKTLINEMKIAELPTLIIYQNNKVIWKHSGYLSEKDLTKQLQ